MKVVRTSQILILVVVLACHPLQAAEPPIDVDAAWSQSSSFESSGEFLKAANALRPVADRYNQDFQSQLQVAWLYFQGGAYEDALIYYQRADAIAATPGMARLGMGWSFLRLGNKILARQAFTQYLDANPDDPQTALEGLALAQEHEPLDAPMAWEVIVIATPLAVQEYFDNPERESGLGAEFGVRSTFDGVSLNATYTYHRFELSAPGSSPTQALSPAAVTNMGSNNSMKPNNAGNLNNTVNGGNGGSNGNTSNNGTYIEHSVFGSLGVGGSRFGASVDGALTTDTRKIVDWAAGGTLRLSTRNHLRIGGLYGEVQGSEILQSSASYDILLYDSWWLTPGGLVQFPPGADVMGAGKLELSHRGPVTVFLSGRFGRTFHEVDLIAPLISSNNDDVIWGAATGISTRTGNVWGVGATLAWEHYEQHLDGELSDGFFGKFFIIMYLGGEQNER